jgi:hypothetical protein
MSVWPLSRRSFGRIPTPDSSLDEPENHASAAVSICKIIAANANQTGKLGYLQTVAKPQNPGLSGFFTDDYLASTSSTLIEARRAPMAHDVFDDLKKLLIGGGEE